MSPAFPRTIPFLAACLWFLASPAFAAGDDPRLAPTASVDGESQAGWAARWWQWAFSFEAGDSPAADRTGAKCAAGQSGKVWFLAGSFEPRPVSRRCTVPAGVTLYFPLINTISYRADGARLPSCKSLAVDAAIKAEDPFALFLEIDGQAYQGLEAHRQPTACFALAGGRVRNAVADGYYVALEPLAPGEHVISFGGAFHGNTQDITYVLVVE